MPFLHRVGLTHEGMVRLGHAVSTSCRDAVRISFELYRFMLPLIIIVRILSEWDLIKYVALPLEPLMSLMGLPADLGIAWAAGMVVNLYSALIIFVSILPGLEPMSVAQVSTFALILLYAHSLPIEGRIAQQCGVSLIGQVVLRMVVAVASGMMLHHFCQATGSLAEPALNLFQGGEVHPPLLQWMWEEVKNFAYILVIIALLLLLQRGIDHFNITRWIGLLLRPLLRLLGLSTNAASTIMVGMAMGIIYGSGLIIKAAHDGSLSKRDIFGTVTLMGLAHAVIEDTALMMLIGSNWAVVLILRPLIAIVVGVVVVRGCGLLRPLPAGS